jgi:hypothetical protein
MEPARQKRRQIILVVVATIGFPLIAFVAVYLWSARIPDRWQEIAPGMARDQVATFIGTSPDFNEDGRDNWQIVRPIGEWNLLISYNEDGTFSSAHLSYSNPVFGKYDRARNYNQYDAHYEVRANR